MDRSLPPEDGDAPQGVGPMAIYLGLYILLLAFFVLLNTLGTYERVKQQKTLQSVGETFSDRRAGIVPSFSLPDPLIDRPAADGFVGRVARLVRSTLPVAQIGADGDGRIMTMTLPVAAVFVPDAPRPSADAARFLDGLAEALAAPLARNRFRVEFALGAPAPFDDGAAPEGGESSAAGLARARAATMAQELVHRGAPPAIVAAGFSAAPPTGNGAETLIVYLIPVETPPGPASPDGMAGDNMSDDNMSGGVQAPGTVPPR